MEEPQEERGATTPRQQALQAARSVVASPTPPPCSAFTLKARVMWALGPGRYGGALTPERVAGILGDPDRPGCSLEPARVVSILRELQEVGFVMPLPRGNTYRLAPELTP